MSTPIPERTPDEYYEGYLARIWRPPKHSESWVIPEKGSEEMAQIAREQFQAALANPPIQYRTPEERIVSEFSYQPAQPIEPRELEKI